MAKDKNTLPKSDEADLHPTVAPDQVPQGLPRSALKGSRAFNSTNVPSEQARRNVTFADADQICKMTEKELYFWNTRSMEMTIEKEEEKGRRKLEKEELGGGINPWEMLVKGEKERRVRLESEESERRELLEIECGPMPPSSTPTPMFTPTSTPSSTPEPEPHGLTFRSENQNVAGASSVERGHQP